MRTSRMGLSTLIAVAAGLAAAQGMAGAGCLPSWGTTTRRRPESDQDPQKERAKRMEIKAWNEAVEARKKAKKGTP